MAFGEIRLGLCSGKVQVPADVVCVEVGVDHDVYVFSVDSDLDKLVQQVAPAVIPRWMRPRPHAGVHHDGLALRVNEEVAVVELNVAFHEYVVFVRRPLRHRHVWEEIARVPWRRDHVEGGAYYDIADCQPVNHLRALLPFLLQRLA